MHGRLTPIYALTHARIEDELVMRGTYDRVYICRQYLRSVDRQLPIQTFSPSAW